ncbi:MAG: hypothetical protein LBO64_08055 [Desulfovibrio sp.]|nr:hypothetical protein [Desulfovibrio sp.]
MSLINTYDRSLGAVSHEDSGSGIRDEMGRAVRELVERATVVENRNACRFALRDAELALDMAEFARKPERGAKLSPALLALTLMRRDANAPEQMQ